MAFLLIDGYNLIGTEHENLEEKRALLIQDLSSYTRLRDHDITLVFDGWKGGVPVETKTRTANITVIYSKLGETADSVIRRIIHDVRKDWIVISTDRQISSFAEGKGHATIPSEEFGQILSHVLDTSLQGDDPKMSGVPGNAPCQRGSSSKRGNPRKPSKSQTRRIRALLKLS